MINSYYTSVHSQHNESLICANIHYICISVYYGRSATINTVVGTNSVCPLVGWFVGWFVGWLGTNCFRLIPVTTWGTGQWGLGRGLLMFMNIHSKEVGDMTWGGASGVLRWAIIFWAIPKFSQDGFLFLEKPRIQENPYKR